ncbi:VOC family protein [Haloferax larsenii]|uniref:Catechol 2,3-dioxygenase n=1 Tax=Haloferax larsenii TaxID=302484 RepID=A0A1H7PXR2_HALLR|nr:VOC family protein [Haloferax larsenii]ELZ80543.1 lactoylglutathione lyase [Haloferax larsenii JCM 13917]SEL40542.1 Catechol 2,3-dioxygenase [Haloferax larsenii]
MASLRAHHVGITVQDLDRTLEFYRDVLGLSVLDTFSVSGEAFSTAVDVPNATGRFAHLDGGDVRVELVEYDPEGESLPDASLNRPGAAHLGLSVDDVDAVVDQFPAHVETLSEPQTTESGTRIAFVRDPEGNLVELLDA